MAAVQLYYFISTVSTIVILCILMTAYSSLFSVDFTDIKSPDVNFTDITKPPCTEEDVRHTDVENATVFVKSKVPYGCSCSKLPCLNKCCPWGEEIIAIDNGTWTHNCVKTRNHTFQVTLFYNIEYLTSVGDRKPKNNRDGHLKIGIIQNFTDFFRHNILVSQLNDLKVFQNGTIRDVFCIGNDCNIDNSSYCLDSQNDNASSEIKMFQIFSDFIFKKYEDREVLIKSEKSFNSVATMISGCFFTLTFVTYTALPTRKKLSGKCLICYFLSMSLANGCLVCQNVSTGPTAILDSLFQLSFLCSFFWVNVISFDLWLRVSGRYMNSPNQRRQHWCWSRFLMYCMYAWGCPPLIHGGSLVVVNVSRALLQREDEGIQYVIFFFMPLGVMVFYNLALFIATSINILGSMDKTLTKSSKKSKNMNIVNERFYVCLKLVPTMGMFWFVHLLVYYLKEAYPPAKILRDLLICFHGFFIFIIFVCKRDVLRQLSEKYCPRLYNKFFAVDQNKHSSKNAEVALRPLRRFSFNDREKETMTTDSPIV